MLARHRGLLVQQQQPGNMSIWHYLKMHRVGGVPTDERKITEICNVLSLSEKLARPLNQTSGGEWQRVRLAGVFIQTAQPQGLLLLDEPLTGLDLVQ